MKSAKKQRVLAVLPGGKSPPQAGALVRSKGTTEEAGQSAAQHRYEILFEHASDAIIVVDLAQGAVTDANNAALELTGYVRGELERKKIDALFPSVSSDTGHSQALSWVHIESSGFFEDVVLRAQDGHPRFVSLSTRTLEVGDSKLSMCILRDVAEKKNMERDLITKHAELRNAYVRLEKVNADLKTMQETLVQSGKLAALGELAAGIAHELNQPLTAVKGFAQEAMAVARMPEFKTEMMESCLVEVVAGADKMERIISHLRNFTRKSTEDFTWVDVRAVIEESLLMLGKQLESRGIEVLKQFDGAVPKVFCNPFQLEQVFINLATNARDAIEAKKAGAGRITIATRIVGDVVEIEYADDGAGIPEPVRAKIFNPFFTTKEVGKGMGLGLSISYGILSRINASILVESTVGKGTVFTIKLPVDYRKH